MATRPDVAIPDVQIPDVAIPEVQIPDVQIPDVQIPDVQIVDVADPAQLHPLCPQCRQPTHATLPGLFDLRRRRLRTFYVCPANHTHLAETDPDADPAAVADACETLAEPSLFCWANRALSAT